jgi:hypothetical protein
MEMLRDFEDAMITICKMQNDELWLGSQTDQILRLCGETLLEENSAGRAPTSHSCWRKQHCCWGKDKLRRGYVLHHIQIHSGTLLEKQPI